MFNPAYPFTKELLESFVTKEVKHFVKSTYKRGIGGTVQHGYLISHYHEKAEAERHFNAIPQDSNRDIFDTDKPGDLERLKKETEPSIEKVTFSKLIHPENEKKATEKYRDNTKRYLYNNTNWDLKGRVTIYPKLYFQLGELYVRMSHQGETISMKFDVLENS